MATRLSLSSLSSLNLIVGALLISAVICTIENTSTRLDLNTAVFDDLVAIPGIGPSYARRILDERDRRGGFRSFNDLLKVQGIGRKTLNRLRPYVTVNRKKPHNTTSQP